MSDTLDDEIPQRGPRKRSITVQGCATSISITDEMWNELKQCAERRCLSINQLVSQIKTESPGNLNRAIRLYVINQRMSQKERDQ